MCHARFALFFKLFTTINQNKNGYILDYSVDSYHQMMPIIPTSGQVRVSVSQLKRFTFCLVCPPENA